MPRNDLTWKGCTAAHPCRVCGNKTDCSYSLCGKSWKCRKEKGEGYQSTATDKNGRIYYLHFADPAGNPEKPSRPGKKPRKRDESKARKTSDELSPLLPERLGEVYAAYTQRSPLIRVDYEDLRRRGLTDEEIVRHGFGSMPSKGEIPKITRDLYEQFGEDLARVPGFYRAEDGTIRMVDWSEGWYIPYRCDIPWLRRPGSEPPIAAIRIRWRKPGKGGKYCWLSSQSVGGCKADSASLVVGRFTEGRPRELFLCEGEVKAIIAARHFGTVAISVPGVDLLNTAKAEVERLRPASIIVSYDADREMMQYDDHGKLKTSVPSAHIRALQWVKDLGITPKALSWWTGIPTKDTPKGLDDAILAGSSFELLDGDQLEANTAELAERFGLDLTPPEKPAEKETKEEESPLETLLRLARNHFEFISANGRLYVSYLAKNPAGEKIRYTQAVDKNASILVDRLRVLFFESQGWAASAEHTRTAAKLLETKMSTESPPRPVTIRTQDFDGVVYIDLVDGAGSVVEICGGTWRIVSDSPARFIRREDMAPLPMPEKGGKVEDLFKYLRTQTEDHKRLVVCWMLQALLPNGPYPILITEGEQGASKTTFMRVSSAFVEPLGDDVGSLPETAEQFAVQASTQHLLTYDNLSGVPGWLSDFLCKASTGGHYSTRQKYSDGDLFRMRLTSPVIMSGISGLIGAPDLMDRAVYVQLKPFGPRRNDEGPREEARTLDEIFAVLQAGEERVTEGDFWRAFDSEAGKIFGALLDTLAKALQIRARRSFSTGDVRLADFAQLSQAAAEALGWDPGFFLKAYGQMKTDLVADTVEKQPVAEAILLMMRGDPARSSGGAREWHGGWSALLERLDSIVPDRTKLLKYWPKTASHLSQQVSRAVPGLRTLGIDVKPDRVGKNRDRVVTIRNLHYSEPEPPAPIVRPSIGNGTSTYGSYSDDDADLLAGLL